MQHDYVYVCGLHCNLLVLSNVCALPHATWVAFSGFKPKSKQTHLSDFK
jgi:hypothetical protein